MLFRSSTLSTNESLVTIPQAAQLLAVSDKTVWRLVRAGQIDSITIGTSRRIRRSAIDRYIHTLTSTQREQAVGFR